MTSITHGTNRKWSSDLILIVRPKYSKIGCLGPKIGGVIASWSYYGTD